MIPGRCDFSILPLLLTPEVISVPCSERRKEIKRRQHRRNKLTHLKNRLTKATKSEKAEIARKLRALSPGAEVLITNWSLEEVDR